MIQRTILTLTFLAVLCASAFADQPQDGLKALEGTWVPTSGEFMGGEYPAEGLKKIKLVIKGDACTATVDSKEDKGTVKIDASKTPKQMDITGTDGPNKGKTMACIYTLVDKDTLKVCYALVGERPNEFKTGKGDGRLVFTYKRDKP